MYCPKCKANMKELNSTNFSAMRCERCDGIWLSYDLENIKEKLTEISLIDTGNPSQGSVYNNIQNIYCPNSSCNELMTNLAFDHEKAVIDFEACPSCKGVFFDAGELHQYTDDEFIEHVKVLLADL